MGPERPRVNIYSRNIIAKMRFLVALQRKREHKEATAFVERFVLLLLLCHDNTGTEKKNWSEGKCWGRKVRRRSRERKITRRKQTANGRGEKIERENGGGEKKALFFSKHPLGIPRG